MIDDAKSGFDYGVGAVPGARRPGRHVRQGLHHRHDRRHREHQPEAERRLGVREVPDHRHRRGGELRQRDPQRARRRSRRWTRPSSTRTRASRRSSRSPQNPNSNTTPSSPNGGAYQLTLQDFGYAYESGKVDRPAGRARRGGQADRHRHRPGAVSDCATATRRRRGLTRAGAARAALRNLAFLSPWLHRHRAVLPLPAGLDGVLLLHPLRRVHARRRWIGLRQLDVRLHALPVLLAGAAQHAVAGRGDGDAAGRLRPRASACSITKIKTGAGLFRTAVLPAVPRPAGGRARWPSSSCSTPAPARSTRSSAGSACPQPGWFNDPAWSKPALTLLALWGIGDLMVIFMAALLDVPREQYEAAELDGAGALAAVPLRHAAAHLADRACSPWSPA